MQKKEEKIESNNNIMINDRKLQQIVIQIPGWFDLSK